MEDDDFIEYPIEFCYNCASCIIPCGREEKEKPNDDDTTSVPKDKETIVSCTNH